ncbi:methylmalonyl-CoA mutase [Actinoplanes tereljensis]|uniref:Fused isobutyryl-CoA mutase n=1 Tax=Paractinoplanes tereljensis TaxID=571912 RepID=A0A919NRY1_9ACTN|nr:fused isobutyryl-CoA mutase/GTPase IcmF [Actinoplanes tereljensis]GIF23603.1 Fused isobutyryl-CoA mutase [Actinoplanes tereljensis]
MTLHVPARPVRFVTAASLFDGHDAAINVMRRLLQAQGAEVVHLGHDRSVEDVVTAVVQEDAQGVALSSYQGGHVEYFGYLVDRLAERGAGHVRVYGGGGGTIVPGEIAALAERGVRIFSPQDGQQLGLPAMINVLIRECDVDVSRQPVDVPALLAGDETALARAITVLQAGGSSALAAAVGEAAAGRNVPVLGITGTGGSGKSSLTDELIRRLRRDCEDKLRVAVIAIDPTRRRGNGALLGDRIRMNSIAPGVVYFRSLATRRRDGTVPEHLGDVIAACKAAGNDLVIVETPGIGQGDAAITSYSAVSLYVMTPEFGSASQLEKIDMLELADVVAINKFERRGGEDARRDVARQLVRNREQFGTPWEDMPVFGTSAARFADDGVTSLYHQIKDLLYAYGMEPFPGVLPLVSGRVSTGLTSVLPRGRERYLSEVADTVRRYHATTAEQVALARRRQHLATTHELLPDDEAVAQLLAATEGELSGEVRELLAGWPATREAYSGTELVYRVRDNEIRTPLTRQTLSGSVIPRVALPRDGDDGELVRFLRAENLPGLFPFAAGVFPLKRTGEAPARMFAGEGDAFRTNRRFHLLSAGQPATRLSTAFDSVTLYGRDPDPRPDVYGKVGTSGVSIATLDDMRELYAGFDLCDPKTSVSMTINGPAPTILAMFLNAAIDQQLAANPDEPREKVVARTLSTVRGTVQADILKEDQGQNTCIFSTEFALRCMADIQEWFIAHRVRNFYSVSISGYHIAEAGANPISQLAFTLANGLTYVEAYRARGMDVNDFAPNLSFFFSNGMDAEYTVIGRVARRIWAIAMRELYGADERSQKLKYHVQTSGRSLHAQEMDFNDIRTTLQALCAIYDNANSLHTNAYDEAVTTPTPQSVRRALAIQMIIDAEWGLAATENALQGSYIVDQLTDLVEQAVLDEFDRISDRGGVLGAMETGYQRGRIQDESMLYEQRKHDGTLPIIGVNTFRNDTDAGSAGPAEGMELARATEPEKQSQLDRLADFKARHATEAPAALDRLKQAASTGCNVFEALMDTVRHCTLGQITDAFFEVGGQYRRNV